MLCTELNWDGRHSRFTHAEMYSTALAHMRLCSSNSNVSQTHDQVISHTTESTLRLWRNRFNLNFVREGFTGRPKQKRVQVSSCTKLLFLSCQVLCFPYRNLLIRTKTSSNITTFAGRPCKIECFVCAFVCVVCRLIFVTRIAIQPAKWSSAASSSLFLDTGEWTWWVNECWRGLTTPTA